MDGLFGRIFKKARKITKKMDQHNSTLAFADAGQPELAEGLMAMETMVEETTGKLLVVGNESTFSQEVIDYALEMAHRMSYEILALNTAPLSCETFKLFSSSRNKICQEFQEVSAENARAFQEKAEQRGISFSCVVKFREPDDALEEIKREFKDIEFVVSEVEETQVSNRPEERERPRQGIFVYAMV